MGDLESRGRPARAASSLLATPNGPFSFAVLSGRFPPPWSVEELDNERRGRSASSPRSWAVSRNRHHVSTLQYSGSPVCSVLNTKVLNLVMAARAQCLLRRDGQRPGQKLAYVYFEDAGPSLSDRPRVFDKGQGRPFLDQLLNSNCRELGVKLAVIRPCNGTSN
jgi:hypothetical protein